MKHASKDIRELAVKLYKSGNYTQQQVADIVGCHYKTIQNWLRVDAEGREQLPLPKGHPPRKLSQEDLSELKTLISSGKYHTLDELTSALGKASRSVIYRAVCELGCTYKKTLFASQRDRPEIIQEREEWRAWMETLSFDDLGHLVFLDESCAKTNFTPLYGWAPKGKRCYGRQPYKWERYTMLSSIRIDGSNENIIFEKGLNKEIFQYFINDVLLPELKCGDIVIMDNCQAHKISFEALEKKGIKVNRLPRYSPDFNPIENMWSQIKGKLRKKEPRDFLELWREVSIAHLDITADTAVRLRA